MSFRINKNGSYITNTNDGECKIININTAKTDSNTNIQNTIDNNLLTFWNASGVTWTSSTYAIDISFDRVYSLSKALIKFKDISSPSDYVPIILQFREPAGIISSGDRYPPTVIQEFTNIQNVNEFQEFVFTNPLKTLNRGSITLWYDMSDSTFSTAGKVYELKLFYSSGTIQPKKDSVSVSKRIGI